MGTPKRRRTITLEVDLTAELTGFRSATRPTAAHRRIARHWASPLLLGPPMSEALLEFVMHAFTDEEAELVAHLMPLWPLSARWVGRLARRPEREVTEILDHLAFTKFIILAAGRPRRYTLLPIVPGTMEMVLMTTDLGTRNAWHRRFAELFEQLWDSGYIRDYAHVRQAPARFLLDSRIAPTLYRAWPAERLDEHLAGYDTFAVGHCQCRVGMQLVGRACNRPTENCVIWGPMAEIFLRRGMMRRSDRSEVLEIKQQAEKKGLVSWTMNELGDRDGNVSCSCCGCCCHALRTLTDHNAPGLLSRPHFMPTRDASSCRSCKRCATVCQTDAWSFIGEQRVFHRERCIGCGLCAVSCNFDALTMEPVEHAPEPASGWRELVRNMAPSYLTTAVRIWTRRVLSRWRVGS